MGTFNINEYYCHDCTYSDAYGRGCEINIMMPAMLAMMGFKLCPKFERKNKEQLMEQLEILEKENSMSKNK